MTSSSDSSGVSESLTSTMSGYGFSVGSSGYDSEDSRENVSDTHFRVPAFASQTALFLMTHSRSSILFLLIATLLFAVAAFFSNRWLQKPLVVPPDTKTLRFVYGAMANMMLGVILCGIAFRFNAIFIAILGFAAAMLLGFTLVFV